MHTYTQPKPEDRERKQAQSSRNLRSTDAASSISQLAAMLNSSPKVAQLRALGESLNHGPHAQALTQWQTRLNQRGGGDATIQRTCSECPQETLQGQFLTANTAQLESRSAEGNRSGLPEGLRAGIESLSGIDMSGVQVHTKSSKPAQLNALAYAQGNDIHLGPGQERHLPHEAWHIVQQRQGRVKPTMQLRDKVPVNDDPALEREADAMGYKALANGAPPQGTSENEELLPSKVMQQREKVGGCQIGPVQVAQRVGQPGDEPSSLESQLATRMEYIWSESNLPGDATLDLQYITEMVQMAGLPAPVAIVTPLDLVNTAIIQAWNRSLPQEDFDALVDANITKLYLSNRPAFPKDVALQEFKRQQDLVVKRVLTKAAGESGHAELSEAGEHSLFGHEDLAGKTRFQKLAAAYLRQNPADAGGFHELGPRERTVLTRKLLRLPGVQAILSVDIHRLSHERVTKKVDRNPGIIKWLGPEIEAAPDSQLSSSIVNNVNVAFGQIFNMVEPDVLAKLPVPKVVVHRNTGLLDALRNRKLSDIQGYRASASRGRRTIDIAENEPVATIVHEIGHQLEYFLPTRHWVNIQSMLRMRHSNAVELGQKDTLQSIYPLLSLTSEPQEAAYRSPIVPVTGLYSAKYYEGASTEVMSMTMEYFSTPEKARQLIEGDPLQAAIILNAIMPKQFAELGPELENLLPQIYSQTFTEMIDWRAATRMTSIFAGASRNAPQLNFPSEEEFLSLLWHKKLK